MGKIIRVFSEKREEFNVEAREITKNLIQNLGIKKLNNVRVFNRYDVQGLTKAEFKKTKYLVFSEPSVDVCFDETVELENNCRTLTVEYLPGQYDQRADSAAQSVQIITLGDKPLIAAAKLYVFEGDILEDEFQKIMPVLLHTKVLPKTIWLSMKKSLK